MNFGQSAVLDWVEDDTIAPDVENRVSLLELAKMTNNAYVEPDDPAWYDISWNIVRFFS
jgi:lipase ATG15